MQLVLQSTWFQTMQNAMNSQAAKTMLKAVVALFAIAFLLYFMTDISVANTGTEFTAATTKFTGWIQGNFGKMAAILSLLIGSIVFAITKDYKWLIGGLVISVVVGIVLGIINASFTALI